MPNATNRHHGRIHAYQRQTNDDVDVIGDDIVVTDEHVAAIRETDDNDVVLATKKNYRNRIKELYEWLLENYPEYCVLGGVQELTDDDVDRAFHHRNTYDLKYEGLNVVIFKAFLAAKKHKADGNLYTYGQMRKYYDAVLWGSGQAKENLPTDFYVEMDKWKKAYKKETNNAKSEGKLEEKGTS